MPNRVAKTAVLLAFSTLTALAVAADPPARVGRVALAQGQVTIGSDIGAEMMAAQVAETNAKRDAALVAGAAVVSPKGAALGTIKSVEGDAVVLDSPSGPVQLKREHFAVNAQGALIALFTAEQVAAAATGNSAQ